MKRKIIISLAILAVFGITLLNRCYYDNEQYLYSNVSCDTTNVTYAGTIAPIMTKNCNACHSGSAASAGVNTETYAGLLKIANSGRLWGTTNGGTMPKAGKMDDCTLSKIKVWINAGAINN